MQSSRPFIGIPADRRLLGHHYFHCVGEKYIAAAAVGADAIPLLVPSLGEQSDFDALLSHFDGVLLTGSASNVEPQHYLGPPSDPGTPHDPHRDATTLPLIPKLVAAGMPVLAICRGFQEMNVAFGGTLWQKLHEVPGLRDHREDLAASVDEQYGPAHFVELIQGGFLHRLAGVDRLEVNSLHWQGVKTLGQGLEVEARAPDGVVEAFRATDVPGFAVGVQWHPEWKMLDNQFSLALFAAFGAAAREYRMRRRS